MVSPLELRQRYVRGELSDAEVCDLIRRGEITVQDAEFITDRSEVEIVRMCRELASARESSDEEEYVGRRRGWGPKGAPAAESPTLQVLAQMSAQASTYTVQQMQFWMDLGRFVYMVAYPKCVQDDRYRDKALVDAMSAVKQYVVDALAFYAAHAEILYSYRELVGYLLHLLERYRQVVKRFAPEEARARMLAEERRLLVYLLDRVLVARLLGIDLRRLARLVARYGRARAVSAIYSELLRSLSRVAL